MVKKLAAELSYDQRKMLRRACEDLFERYRFYKTVGFDDMEDKEAETRRNFCERVEKAVDRLPAPEREQTKLRYMKDDYVLDFTVYTMELGISEGTYTKRRYNAFVKLADVFNLDYKNAAS